MDINHFRMAYDSQGSGTPLLLIHGYPLNRQIWDAQRQSLASVLHLITPDLRGFGESGATPGPYSMDMLADDCAALLAGLGISQPVVVGGLSMGGYVTLAFARRHPDLLAGLLLISTRAAPDSPEGRANRDKSIALAQEKGVAAVTAGMLPKLLAPQTYTANPGLVAQVQEIMAVTSLTGMVGALEGMRDRPDASPDLAKVSVPTLVIHGGEDHIIPVAEAGQMAAMSPQIKLAIIQNAGHLLNMEQPEAFNRAVLDWITSVRSAPGSQILMTKDEILDALEDEREKMLAALDGLTDEEMLDPTVADSWSIKDILAHLNAWEAELVRMLWQLLQGSKPSTVQLSGESIDERNEQWYALYKKRPLEAVLEDYQAVRQQTIRRVDQFSEAELNDPAKYPALRGIPLWRWIAEDSFEHEAEHLSDIVRWKDQRIPRDSAKKIDG